MTKSVRSLMASGVVYAEARLQLAKLESVEALRLGIRIAIGVMLAAICLLMAYASGIVALCLWIAQTYWQGQLIPAVLIITGSHFIAALVCALYVARASRDGHLFEATLTEFTEDKRWLQANTPVRS